MSFVKSQLHAADAAKRLNRKGPGAGTLGPGHFQVDIRTEGFRELADLLKDAPAGVRKKSLNRILREAANELKEEIELKMSGMIEFQTGRTRRALKVVKRRGARQVLTGERSDDPILDVFIDKGQSRADQEGAWYAHFVHWGHAKAGGGTVAGRPYMTQAFEDSAEIIAGEALAKLEMAIERSLAQKRR